MKLQPFTRNSLCLLLAAVFISCGVYSLQERGTVDPDVKTVRVQMIENRAGYVNPQLSPTLTERLRQKIVNQTRLTNTNNDNADYDISGFISDYSVSSTGVAPGTGGVRQQNTANRLTVTVSLTRVNQLTNDVQQFNVSRSFEFSANQSLQQAESALLDEMIRNLTDEIFNRIFSNW